MDTLRILELKESRLKDNSGDAARLRQQLNGEGVTLVNVMSAPGSGKTTLLTALGKLLAPAVRVGVLEADIDGDVDARALLKAGIPAIQVHTGGMCHLDADMTRQSLAGLGKGFDLIFLENIGNLVCPAEYDTGAQVKLALLSVPEGDDKPLKYPLLFSTADAVVITKTDTAPWFDFSVSRVREAMAKLNPAAPVFETAAREGDGLQSVADWLLSRRVAGKGAFHVTGD